MICTQPISLWTSKTAPATVSENLCDAAAEPWYNGCLFTKPNHTLPLTQPCTSSSVHPKGAIHFVRDVKYNQPTNPPVQGSPSTPTLALLHIEKKSVATTWLDKPFGLNEQRVLSITFQLRWPLESHSTPCTRVGVAQRHHHSFLLKYLVLQCFSACTVYKVFFPSCFLFLFFGGNLAGIWAVATVGGTAIELGRRTVLGLKPCSQRGMGLWRDVVRKRLGPTKDGKTAKI